MNRPKVCWNFSEDGLHWGEEREDRQGEVQLFQTGFPSVELEVPLGRSPGSLGHPWLAMSRGQGYGSMWRSGLYEG